MRFDDLRPAWQEQNDHLLSPEDREAMIARVCRRVERVGGAVLRRDVTETIAAVVVIIFFGQYFYGAPNDYVVSKFGAGFLVCWALFIIFKMHRTRTIQRPASLDASVYEFCRVEMERLDRQIQLLRSVLWWYIAPAIIGANVMFIGMAGLGAASLAYGIATLMLACGIYWLNMRAVAKNLLPLRNELANLLSQLEDGGSNTMYRVEQPLGRWSKFRRLVSVMVLVVGLAALGIASAVLVGQAKVEYPKRAPFSGVRWEGAKPVVKIGDEWFTLVSLDGIAAEDIVAFSWRTYVDRWRKRFEEDLVEVLTRMGHPPQDTVTLVVQSRTSSETRTLEDVPMTEANRQAIYKAAIDRNGGDRAPATESLIPLEDAALFRTRIYRFLNVTCFPC
jgi:hypothetical protein